MLGPATQTFGRDGASGSAKLSFQEVDNGTSGFKAGVEATVKLEPWAHEDAPGEPDPDVLGTPDVRNVVPEPAKARAWYQKAAQLGSADAQRRLAQLPN